MLTLNEQDLQQLNSFIQELPLKHGLPLLNFLNAKIAEQNQEAKKSSEEPKDNSENIKS
jgi:hypothetical protein